MKELAMRSEPDLPDTLWLDSMYNNRSLVPDHARYLERWKTASQSARDRLPCDLDLPYGPAKSETLDVFKAKGKRTSLAPVMVFIHGGYWRSLDKSEYAFVAPAFTSTGTCVVVPNYELCPAITIPGIALQMVHALAWTYRNIERFGGDPDRITVVGHSAGGHLAAMLLTCLWQEHAKDLPADLVKNALGISGLYELESIMRTPFLQDSLRLAPDDALRASPAWMPAPDKGMFYTVAGTDESAEFLRHNALIEKKWGDLVVPVREVLPGLNHFSIMDALTQPGQRLNQLAQHLLSMTA
jgi:arylformamidase